jgi:integrase
MSKRRASGSGALLKWRKDGQVVGWIGVADLGIVDGKRRRQKVYGKTQAEVQKRLGEILHKKDAGTLPKPGRLTVADWLATWLKGLDRRPRTVEHYESNVRLHIVPLIGSKVLGKLTASDVEAMLAKLREQGSAPRSVHHARAVLRNALKKAVRNRLVPYNVAAESDAPKVPHEEMKTFDRDQVRQLLEALKGSPLQALFVLAVGLGIREGELLGLRWKDIDMDRGILHVTRALQWIHVKAGERQREPALVEPKSRTSQRTLPLSAPAVDVLRAHRMRWANEKLRLGDRWLNDWDLVFVGPQGEPLHAKNVWREWRRILKAAELPVIRPHDLRHTAGTLLREQGVDIKVIQETLGHSSISTTLDAYGHVTPGLRELGVGAQAAILGGA